MAGLNRASIATVSRAAAYRNGLSKLEMFFCFAKEINKV